MKDEIIRDFIEYIGSIGFSIRFDYQVNSELTDDQIELLIKEFIKQQNER